MAKKNAGEPNLGKEVAALAGHIGRALKSAKDSEELKQLQRETAQGLRAAGGRIVSAVEKAKRSRSTKQIKAQANKVLEIAKDRGKPTMENVSKNLSAGLRFISQELEALADRLSKGGK